MNCIICRYHEIATKGHNRNMFERCLVDNIKMHLREIMPECRVRRVRGRVWVDVGPGREIPESVMPGVIARLRKIFGLESFSPAMLLPVDMTSVRAAMLQIVPPLLAETGKARPTFRVRARRSNKKFPLTSKEIEIDLVTSLADKIGEEAFSINLSEADVTLGCEIRDEFAAVYVESFASAGGLPVGSNPRVLTLLSGGIDSPVAAWMIMKRGSATDFITFHSAPYTPQATVDKVKGIAAILNTFQRHGRLFIVNLAEFQKNVRDCCSERLRTVLYRRAMLRIAEMVALREDCHALVTGDALGQVASQTVGNMDTINRAVDLLVLRPLVGADKLETIRIAAEIGTLDSSNVQVPDSCTVFAPANPATSVPESVAVRDEAKIVNYKEILEKIVSEIEVDA